MSEPDVELTLPADPESVVLARQMVRGLIDVLGWSEESRNDISIAVTEACTNAVLHAYPDGDGEYDVFAWVAPERLVVAVRDHGQGISPRVESPSAGLGLGLPLMLAIGDEVYFSSDGEGATEVRMAFSPWTAQGSVMHGPARGAAGDPRPELAQPVLERVVAALAARVDLPLDRLSDAQIASAALVATTASRSIPGGELRVELDGEPGAVIVRLGPLPDGAAARVVEDTALPGVGPIVDRLVDRWSVAPADGGESLSFGDHRRRPGPSLVTGSRP